ncbi:hypothetical protein DIZ81_10760 [Legionella taurinensis]|uniref:Uncharacterized protein n=1 Tax=Legionella taurinensis TaxID=70611 RepID=A0A3A5L3U0_9GAMM|nr:hypothetical protein [Legionella taurinensis]MDX1838328.1 hypothetical protein [Legionella taurinensis]PUT39093.1 hypothetical protein DB744_10770 [Legionella taurinensis]PUT39547.1 hypothetical protein DB746_13425 [Legionella taurinensis]PUT43549.1 hypothetical protein DB743_10160 [Legionella taurinensis]PUT45203.1 hypothetical protein DB745_13365 [Legionella taurinensis]
MNVQQPPDGQSAELADHLLENKQKLQQLIQQLNDADKLDQQADCVKLMQQLITEILNYIPSPKMSPEQIETMALAYDWGGETSPNKALFGRVINTIVEEIIATRGKNEPVLIYEMGSGEGQITLEIVSNRSQTSAVLVEIYPPLAEKAAATIDKRLLSKRAKAYNARYDELPDVVAGLVNGKADLIINAGSTDFQNFTKFLALQMIAGKFGARIINIDYYKGNDTAVDGVNAKEALKAANPGNLLGLYREFGVPHRFRSVLASYWNLLASYGRAWLKQDANGKARWQKLSEMIKAIPAPSKDEIFQMKGIAKRMMEVDLALFHPIVSEFVVDKRTVKTILEKLILTHKGNIPAEVFSELTQALKITEA